MDSSQDHHHSPLSSPLRIVGECLLFYLAFISAWPFGSVSPYWEALTATVITVLTALWAIHSFISKQNFIRIDFVSIILASLVIWTGLQLLPLPKALVSLVAPSRVALHEELVPKELEELSSSSRNVPPIPSWIPVSIDTGETTDLTTRLLYLLLVYLVARNWLVTNASLVRFGWLALINGVLLAVLALGQFFSSPRNMVYWSIPSEGTVYGPFICRNHYPDYMAVCVGMTLAILLKTKGKSKESTTLQQELPLMDKIQEGILKPFQVLDQPAILASLLALGLLIVSMVFSLSRGGVLALAMSAFVTLLLYRSAHQFDKGKDKRTLWLIFSSIALSLILASWFGWKPVQERFGELFQGEALDDRTPLWKSAAKEIPGFWLTGSGGGTFRRIEPLNRTTEAATSIYHNAHNEYLEALLEGGVVRFCLTVFLAVGVLWRVGQGYLARHTRNVGPYLLGLWFGLAVIVLHALTDFALHIPAVALIAVIATAFAIRAAEDSELAPPRTRHRTSSSSSAKEDKSSQSEEREPDPTPEPVSSPEPSPAAAKIPIPGATSSRTRVRVRRRVSSRSSSQRSSQQAKSNDANVDEESPRSHRKRRETSHVRGNAVQVTAIFGVVFALLGTWDAWNRSRADDYALYAAIYAEKNTLEDWQASLKYHEAEAKLRPLSAQAWTDLAEAHLRLAKYYASASQAAVVGPAIMVDAPEVYPSAVQKLHIDPALAALQKARSIAPTMPEVQTRLAEFSGYFAKAEPRSQYLERARRVMQSNAEVWYASGEEALRTNQPQLAWKYWQKSLQLSLSQLKPILRQAGKYLSAQEVLDQLLPDQPSVLLAAMNQLYPNPRTQEQERLPFLKQIVKSMAYDDLEAEQCVIVAQVYRELGDDELTEAAWQKAILKDRNRIQTRLEYLSWLEEIEEYDLALEQLRWLQDRIDYERLKDRIEIAQHGSKLRREIGE